MPPLEIPWFSFLLEAEWTPGLVNVGWKRHLKISKNPTRNQNQNRLSCGIVPQLTAPPLTPNNQGKEEKYTILEHTQTQSIKCREKDLHIVSVYMHNFTTTAALR